jgi:hypothetical protein
VQRSEEINRVALAIDRPQHVTLGGEGGQRQQRGQERAAGAEAMVHAR